MVNADYFGVSTALNNAGNILAVGAHGDDMGGSARGAVYVLDMGRPVRILDVAQQMIRLAGLKPDKDIKIEIVGLRPGEKLHESLFCDHEKPVQTALSSVMEAVTGEENADVEPLVKAAVAQDNQAIMTLLSQLINDCEINA